jgi:hypothetical protein
VPEWHRWGFGNRDQLLIEKTVGGMWLI